MLNTIEVNDLFSLISKGNPVVFEKQQQLKEMMRIDAKAMAEAKKLLPYFIGATFKNNIRHAANFICINYLILDFDSVSKDPEFIKAALMRIAEDKRVMLAFVSPSGNGIKCVFKLEEAITNSLQFSKFYKSFAFSFASQLQLQDFVDYSTSDVTRVCFIAYDKNAHFNPDAVAIKPTINSNELALVATEKSEVLIEIKKPILDDDIYKQILEKLNPSAFIKRPKQIFVPAELSLIEHLVEHALAENGFVVKEVRAINYGKKFIITNGLHLAELNIYFGKNGFQVVKSSKTGTHPDFNEAVSRIVTHVLYSKWTTTNTQNQQHAT